VKNKLHILFDDIKNKFEKDLNDNFIDGDRIVGKINQAKKIRLEKKGVIGGLKTILNKSNEKNANEFLENINSIRTFLPFCSTPKAFKTAWELRAKSLSINDAEAIVKLGGQFIPENTKVRIFKTEMQGNLYHNKKFMKAVRHSEGNYEDKLDDLGNFRYEPPENISGMIRYRLSELISEVVNIPYVLLVIMWFEYKIQDDLKQIFIICPAKVNINKKININKDISNPINLQLIERDQCLSIINRFESLNDSDLTLRVRDELPENISREYSYLNINNSKKGRLLKSWAKKNGKKCIDGIKCNNIEFKDLKDSEIAFGHIISQNWSKSFTYLLNKINHPDNLYLTCKKCNSSLSDGFPDKILKNKIYSEGTIGDWLRKNKNSIEKVKS
tara:strand:+ start:461 stop:1621 length:1161 start_codon:yes stop_codon:yes gene_type:complete